VQCDRENFSLRLGKPALMDLVLLSSLRGVRLVTMLITSQAQSILCQNLQLLRHGPHVHFLPGPNGGSVVCLLSYIMGPRMFFFEHADPVGCDRAPDVPLLMCSRREQP
jgi:hypothetical protein